MATEQLTYAQIGERLSVSAEAARAIVKRHCLPRSRRRFFVATPLNKLFCQSHD